jgi:hypothetical protein
LSGVGDLEYVRRPGARVLRTRRDTLPEPKPGAGQVLVKTLACGIRGSTATVGVDGVATAFADLANPERHTKIIVEPWR